MTFLMVSIVQIVLDITSLAKLAGGWLMLSAANLLHVEIVHAASSHSYLHSIASSDLYHNLGMVNKCLFNQ